MKKHIWFALSVSFFVILPMQSQEKKWTLMDCIQYALKNNISIRQSELDTKIAVIEKSDAVGNFLPSINADASHSWNIGLTQDITTGILRNKTTQYTSVGMNVGVNLYNGLQSQNKLRRANLSNLAARYSLSKMQDDISLNVANAFLEIVFNKENLKVQKEQLANNQKQQQRTQELVSAGSIPRGDLLDMKATVATSQQAVIVAENALLISRLSLAQLLQLDEFKNFDIEDRDYAITESPTMAETPEGIFNKAQEVRVELKIARTNLEIAEKDISVAKGTYQPTLQGFYSFTTRASSSERVVGFDTSGNPIVAGALPVFNQFSDNKGHSFGVQLNIPILNGFAARNAVARSKIARDRYKIAYDQARLDLERNVYTAFTDANGALNAYEAAVTALEAREEAFNYGREKLAAGMMTAFDFNQAQTLFANAQSEVLRTKYDYIFRVKVVEFYFGIPITQIQ
jgi:outer membrane protein